MRDFQSCQSIHSSGHNIESLALNVLKPAGTRMKPAATLKHAVLSSVTATGLLWSLLYGWLIMAGTGLPPDDTEHGRIHNATLIAGAKQALASLTTIYGQVMQSLGVTTPVGHVFDDTVVCLDRYLHLSIKDLEYPRSDLRKDLRFVGTVPTGLLGDSQLPP